MSLHMKQINKLIRENGQQKLLIEHYRDALNQLLFRNDWQTVDEIEQFIINTLGKSYE